MGRWRDAADGVTPKGKFAPRCAFYRYLETLDPDDRAELQQVIDEAVENIESGDGRYIYIQEVIVAGGGQKLSSSVLSRHIRGVDSCPTS